MCWEIYLHLAAHTGDKDRASTLQLVHVDNVTIAKARSIGMLQRKVNKLFELNWDC
jgi:hypothetical protein